jgi:hypothetical protein
MRSLLLYYKSIRQYFNNKGAFNFFPRARGPVIYERRRNDGEGLAGG